VDRDFHVLYMYKINGNSRGFTSQGA
jgi:hypothetical protein